MKINFYSIMKHILMLQLTKIIKNWGKVQKLKKKPALLAQNLVQKTVTLCKLFVSVFGIRINVESLFSFVIIIIIQ
jgi:hypothetical protein